MGMDIKDLDKKQMVLLTLLITFVVSIATGIVTVSLMNQAPKAIPQTINNVIQRTIEKVTTVTEPSTSTTKNNTNSSDTNTSTNSNNEPLTLMEGSVLINIYPADYVSPVASTTPTDITTTTNNENNQKDKSIGQGIIISDIGLVLVDSSILSDGDKYIVVLDKTDFDATVIKKFNNGFSILKISEKVKKTEGNSTTSNLGASAGSSTTPIDKTKQ